MINGAYYYYIILITVQQSMQTIMHRCDYIVCTYLNYYKSDQGLRSCMVTKRGKVFQILITEGKNENLKESTLVGN